MLACVAPESQTESLADIAKRASSLRDRIGSTYADTEVGPDGQRGVQHDRSRENGESKSHHNNVSGINSSYI